MACADASTSGKDMTQDDSQVLGCLCGMASFRQLSVKEAKGIQILRIRAEKGASVRWPADCPIAAAVLSSTS